MRSSLLILSFMLIVVSAKSQKWQPGYFVDVKNNHMAGDISVYPSGHGPVKDEGFILFKNKGTNEIKLSCSDIKYFVVNKDSFVVAHPPMNETWPNELDFVKVVLDEPVKLYAYHGSPGGGSSGGRGFHVSPGIGVGMGTGGYSGGGVGLSFGSGSGEGGSAKMKVAYYFGPNTASLTQLTIENFEDVMSDIMGDEPEVVDAIRAHKFGLPNIDKLIAYFKKVQASHPAN